LLAGSGCGPAQAAPPSTFGTVVGNAVLCLDNLDNKYFYSYLTAAFGAPYKHDGGAFWFQDRRRHLVGRAHHGSDRQRRYQRADLHRRHRRHHAGKAGTDVTASAGLHYTKKTPRPFPSAQLCRQQDHLLQHQSKVYCAQYKPLPPPDAR